MNQQRVPVRRVEDLDHDVSVLSMRFCGKIPHFFSLAQPLKGFGHRRLGGVLGMPLGRRNLEQFPSVVWHSISSSLRNACDCGGLFGNDGSAYAQFGLSTLSVPGQTE